MYRLRIKRFLAEREVLIGLVIFGVFVMIADISGEWKQGLIGAVTIRIVALIALLGLLLLDVWILRRQQVLPVPLMFTEETEREAARILFERFLQKYQLNLAAKVIERLSRVRRDDLVIRPTRSNPRRSEDPKEWEVVWDELVKEWEREVDKQLLRSFTNEAHCYHLLPHLVLPLAFALGASVGLRRSIVIYHQQEERFYRVLNLAEPRCIFEAPSPSTQAPERTEKPGSSDKLILHLVISDRHSVNFQDHPDYIQATSVGLAYKMTLPDGDWLPYVRQLVNGALSVMGEFKQVEICLICPCAVAFALGMAFSRTPRITICHWINNKYVPVFSLKKIEQRLSFD